MRSVHGFIAIIKLMSPDPGEVGADGVFPHLYNGGQLGSGEVDELFVVEKEGNEWEIEKIKASEWLVY